MKPLHTYLHQLLALPLLPLLPLLTAACTADDTDLLPPDGQPVAVDFDVYMGGQADTRAGLGGELTTANLADFGVYAYNTGTTPWASMAGSFPPDYMYNQHVLKNSDGTWGYSPLKYWPNGSGTANDDTGQGATQSRVSFFAYAPFVNLNITDLSQTNDPTDDPTSGITHIDACGHAPLITYKLASDYASQVDFLYANTNTDLTKQAVNGKVQFDFRHALAAIDIKVQLVYNLKEAPSAANPVKTKVYISSVALGGSAIHATGRFSLANATWSETSGSAAITIPTDQIAPALRGAAPDATIDAIRLAELNNWATHSGVTETETHLTNNAVATMIIPAGSTTLTPTLNYNFVTLDDDLALSTYTTVDAVTGDVTHRFARISNSVSASSPAITIEGGKRYTLLCRIGVETMEFGVIGVTSMEVAVTGVDDWDFPIRFYPRIDNYNIDDPKPRTLSEGDN